MRGVRLAKNLRREFAQRRSLAHSATVETRETAYIEVVENSAADGAILWCEGLMGSGCECAGDVQLQAGKGQSAF